MKIRQINAHFSWYGKTILFVMRAFIGLFCMVAFGFSSKHGLSQTTVVIDADTTMTVYQVFGLIKKQTGSTFLYDYDMFKDSPAIRLKKGTVKTGTLLDKIRNTGNFKYEYTADKTVIFSKIKDSPSSQPDNRPVIRQLRVTGTVTDPNGSPLPGVNIVVKDARHGTMSDENGNYSILVNATDILTFSFVGFKKVELAVDGREVIDVQMEEDVMSLEGVEVNAGYWNVKDRERTGNISRVTAEEIHNQPVTSPLMALQGRIPGLEISPVSGTPGIAPRIRIRGQNSLRMQPKTAVDGGNPLFIIDGVMINSEPVDNFTSIDTSPLGGGYDALSTINPENIESIEILKDADATAIYGARGANGVILITTKQGRSSGKTDFDLSMYRGIGSISNRMDILNTDQYLQMRYEAFANAGQEPNPSNRSHADVNGMWSQDRYTDWQDVLFGGTSDITDIQGNISGGNSQTFFRTGGGYHKETMVFPGDFGYRRATGHLNVGHTSVNKRFKANLSINYGTEKQNVFNGNFVNDALTLPPNAPQLYDENGELNWELAPNGIATWTNPMAKLETSQTSEKRNFVANGNFSYELLANLTGKINLGYTDLNGEDISKIPFTSMAPHQRFGSENPFGLKASARFITNQRRSILIEPQLNYTKSWYEHTLDVLVGASYQENRNITQVISATGYTSDALLNSVQGAETINFTVDNDDEYKYNSVFGRIGYKFKGRYLINLTGRREGSSRFGPNNRFGNFGAVGAAWIFSKELWMSKVFPMLSFGKFRASYGITGNDQIGNYQYLDLYSLRSRGYQNGVSLSPSALFNPNYSWEETKKLEAAIELGFAKDRMMLELSWYRNRSSNQLVDMPTPAITGFSSLNGNLGATVENTGWEVVLRGDVIRNDKFQWNASVNLSVPRNKLIAFPGIEESPYATIYKVGEPLYVQWFYTWERVDPEIGVYQFLDINNDGFINDEDRTFVDIWNIDYYGGLNNSLSYEGLQLSFLFQFTKQNGAKYLNGSQPGSLSNQPEYVLNRWQNEGDITDVQKFSYLFGETSNGYRDLLQSDSNVEDASFIRLKTLSLSYLLPPKIFRNIGIENLKLFLQGQNLFTITNYSNLDPETGNAVPPLRMLTTGFQITF